jgi:hypothetical protein
MFFPSRRAFLLSGFGLAAGTTVGCGTIMYPERRGQPAGHLDWGVVAMDALALLFFFIPGVIAFAVDFSTGAIYLPSGYGPYYEDYGARIDPSSEQQLTTLSVPTDRLSPKAIEEAVSRHSGREVKLRAGEYQTHELQSIDQFWTVRESLNRSAATQPARPG